MTSTQDGADSTQAEEALPSVEEMAGQMVVAGFEGTDAPPAALRRLVGERHLGGVILFRRNVQDPAQVRALVDAVRADAPGPSPLVCVDQEGGRVARFGPPFTVLPPARALGATGDAALAIKWGKVLAAELTQVGVNLNLAPVVDVDTNPDNPVIGDRALSSEAELVARLGMSIVLGMQGRGVGACAKHFPGHGEADVDSHEELPVIDVKAKRLKKVELLPFKRLAQGGVAAVMPGHLRVPLLDPELPASLSSLMISGLLRGEWGYDGLVITDDLEMAPIANRWEVEEAVDLAVDAGVDLLLFCHSLDKAERAVDRLVARVQSGDLDVARLEASWRRIAAFKERYPAPTAPLNADLLGAAPHARLLDAIRGDRV